MPGIPNRKTIVVGSVILLSLLLPGAVLLFKSGGENERLPIPVDTVQATRIAKTPWVVTPVIEGGGGAIEPVQGSVKDCTYTSDYWAAHPENWRAENILIGEHAFSKPDALQALKSGEASLQARLLKQFLAVVLNSLAGADRAAIQPVLVEASDWLNRDLSLIELPEPESQRGGQLVAILEGYNNGLSGPGLCPDQPPTPTPTLTPTPTPTATPIVYSLPPLPVTGKTEDHGDKGADTGDEPESTPTPTPSPSQTPEPPGKPEPSNTVAPTATNSPEPIPTASPIPNNTPRPSVAPAPTSTPKPKEHSKHTKTPKPKKTKKPKETPKPKKTKEPKKTPKK